MHVLASVSNQVQLDDFDDLQTDDDDNGSAGTLEEPVSRSNERSTAERSDSNKRGKSPQKQLAALDSAKLKDVQNKFNLKDRWPQRQKKQVAKNEINLPVQSAKSSRHNKREPQIESSKKQHNDVIETQSKSKSHRQKHDVTLPLELRADRLQTVTSKPFDCDNDGRSRSPQVSPFQKVKEWIFAPQVTPEPIEQPEIELTDIASRQAAAAIVAKRSSRKRKKGRHNNACDESVA